MRIYQGELLINCEHLLYTLYACYNVNYINEYGYVSYMRIVSEFMSSR